MLSKILMALKDSWGIETEPIGRTGTRFAVTGDRGRPLCNPVVLDLLSEEAVGWLVRRTSEHEPGQDAVVLAAFSLAESVWLTDQEAAGVQSVVRLHPAGDQFALVTVES